MLERLIRIVFLGIAFIYLSGMVYQVVYFTYFKVNQEEIVAKYCINKDKPEMHCDGQCHLNKQLKKIEQNSEELSSEERQNRLPQIELNFLIGILPSQVDDMNNSERLFFELLWNSEEELCFADSNQFWHPPQV